MKKNYAKTLFLTAMTILAVLPAAAQQGWTVQHKAHKPAKQAPAQRAGDGENVVALGYASPNDALYEYDGIAYEEDTRAAVAILLTPEMLKPYAGGVITGMKTGWGTTQMEGQHTCFVRKGFSGETVAGNSTPATVKYDYNDWPYSGWNDIAFDQTYVIPENPDTLLCGFYTDLTAGVYAIPTLWPHDVENSLYLWLEGDYDKQGNENWFDGCSFGKAPIMLTVSDEQGNFAAMAEVTALYYDRVVLKDKPATAMFTIANSGSAAINDIELSYKLGEQTKSYTVELGQAIASGTSSRVSVPVHCFGSGVTEMTLSKVNGKDNRLASPQGLRMLGVPGETASAYTFRPVVEFFESENSYMSPTYYEECIQPTLEPSAGKVTYVSQHMDDQFMTGDDDALALSLWLCDGDSMDVELPCMGINRTRYVDVCNYVFLGANTPLHSSLYPMFGTAVIDSVLQMPTFAAIDGEAVLNGGQLAVKVYGDVASGVLAGGEELYYTVYLMEDNVKSESQLFWTKDDEEEHLGEYTHPTIIREVMTGVLGDELGGEGEFVRELSTEIDTEWNSNNLRIVAFVHRGGDNDNFDRQIINSTEFPVSISDGIASATAGPEAKDGKQEIYDLQGRRVGQAAQHGVYIINGKKVVL